MAGDPYRTQPFDCMLYFYQSVQEPRIRCIIQFRDHVDEATLRRAVERSLDAVPLLACAFDEAHCRWTERRFSAEDMLHVVEDAEEQAQVHMLSSIDCTREPQLKLYLLKGARRDTLCAIINHQVCDGAGFKAYLYLLCELYTKCERGEESGLSGADGERNLNQLLRNLHFGRKLRILLSKEDAPKPDPAMVLPLKGGENPAIVVTWIEEELFGAMRRCARGRNASINDLLLTAYARALQRTTGCRRIVLPCPVDLRRYLKPGQRCGICNLTGNYTCYVDVSPEEPFYETLGKVSARISAQKAGDTCLKGPMLFHMAFHLLPIGAVRALFEKVSPVPVTGYTNLGVLDEAQLRFGGHGIENALLTTAIKKPPYFQLSVSTFRGRCALTGSLYSSEADRQVVEEFFRRIIAELEDNV